MGYIAVSTRSWWRNGWGTPSWMARSWGALSRHRPGWEELADGWVEDLVDRGRRPNTLQAYERELRRFADWAAECARTPWSVTAADVRDYVRHMRTVRALGDRSICRNLTVLRGFFGWAVREGIVADDPTARVQGPSYRRPLGTALPAQKLAELLAEPRRRGGSELRLRDSALLKTLAWSGLRLAEMVALDVAHLDLAVGQASVLVVDGKGGRDRAVPVVEPLRVELSEYLVARRAPAGEEALWISQRRSRLSRRQIADLVRQYGERVGVELSTHRLRAQCGVDMIRSGGASLAEVRAVLGHAGYDTLVPYTMLAASEARDSLEQMVNASKRPVTWSKVDRRQI